MKILPQTKPGKWSGTLILYFFMFLSTFFALVATGQRGGKTFFSNMYLTGPMLAAVACAFASLGLGIYSIVKKKERAVTIFLACLVGIFVLMFVAGEIFSPH